MGTNMFNDVTGFQLKFPSYNPTTTNPSYHSSDRGNWIQLNKNKNELPTATLRTWVLYYRKDGDNTGSTNAPDDQGSLNYRFYNNEWDADGRQLGWIWGFPLFNIGDAGSWPRWSSCTYLSGTGTDICGNETMLVDLTAHRNIIVLDFSGYGDGTANDAFKEISGNLPDVSNNAFYLTLRIKSSTETPIMGGSTGNDNTKPRSVRPYSRNNKTNGMTQRWCTLVKYTYECDIIGPKPFLDLTNDYFSYVDGNYGKIFGENTIVDSVPVQLAVVESPLTSETYTNTLHIAILTGLGYYTTTDYNQQMNTDFIFWKLLGDVHSTTNAAHPTKRLMQKQNWDRSGNKESYTVARIIGGFNSLGSSATTTTQNIGYYGDNYGLGDRQTKLLETEGWQWDLSLNNSNSDNSWNELSGGRTYDLNNILWCSLRSPRKTRARKWGNDGDHLYRYVTNFIDLSGTNICNGGGYARYPNTIDLPRKSWQPYYSSTSNSNTTTIADYQTSNSLQYLDTIGSLEFNSIRSIDEITYFRVYFKLLIPPKDDGSETFSITYTFGRNLHPSNENSGVVTFFRSPDMSGNPTGGTDASDNTYAIRDNEEITLTWDNDSVNGVKEFEGDISMCSIVLTDVASGFSYHGAQFSLPSGPLFHGITSTPDYAISCNVFQTVFYSKNATGLTNTKRNEIPYTVKIFDTNLTDVSQNTDISYIPQNYEPFRYINFPLAAPAGSAFYFDSSFKSTFDKAPLILYPETLEYNNKKVYGIDQAGAAIIAPSGENMFPQINIDISSSVIDNSYNYIAVSGVVPAGEIAMFINPASGTTLTTSSIAPLVQPDLVPQTAINFANPYPLDLGSNFIPDYWRLPQKINTLRKINENEPPLYNYFNTWNNQIKVSMVFDILSIILKEYDGEKQTEIGYLLVNSHEGSNNDVAVTTAGKLVGVNSNIIFAVQGALGLPPDQTLNTYPIIVQLQTSVFGPFGSNTLNYIGDRSGNTGAPIRGIDVPYPSPPGPSGSDTAVYKVDTLLPNTMRRGNNTGATTDKAYNGLYNITMIGWDDGNLGIQNPSFKGLAISPTPLKVLLVDISSAVQTNPNIKDMLSEDNTTITLKWSSFFFSSDTTWNSKNGQGGDIEWTITKYNVATGVKSSVTGSEGDSIGTVTFDTITQNYQYIDSDIRIYDKLNYSVSGIYKWTGLSYFGVNVSNIPTISVAGFTTTDCFICKYNRFQYGRFNTTSTNLKLYRPLLINTSAGQVNEYGEKTCGGGCSDPNKPGLTLFSGGSAIQSNNNIYASVTNQMTKKQTYVTLAKARFRPFR